MKIDRLIGVLSVLLQKEKVTAKELSEKFEISQRTVFRYIDDLCCAGIPIAAEQGRHGGISIMKGYKIDRTLLSSDDMRAILTGLRSLDSISGTSYYRQLMEKMSADSFGTLVDDHIIVDLSGWDKTIVSDKIELIKIALKQRNCIRFRYCSPNGEEVRTIEPYHIVFQWSNWYVWGYCLKRCDYRMFKLTRMSELNITDDKIKEREVPEYSCDKPRHTKGGAEAVVRFDNSVKWRIIDEFGTDIPQFGENEIILRFTWSDVPSLYQYILSFGDKAEIISTEEYRRGFSEILKNLKKIYKI